MDLVCRDFHWKMRGEFFECDDHGFWPNRSAPSETPTKVSAATTRVSKTVRGAAKSNSDAASPLQSSRLSVDRSPRSVPSKPALDRRSPKLGTPPEVSSSLFSLVEFNDQVLQMLDAAGAPS